jgi:hypothetical protein
MPTKKASRPKSDDLRPQYDLSALGPPVRGKYFARASAGTNVVLLDPDVARAFPTAEAVNTALRMLVDVASVASPKKTSPDRQK